MRNPILTSHGWLNSLSSKPGIFSVEKFGRNIAIASGVAEDIWDGSSIYTFLSAGEVMSFVSDSLSDDSGGVGALTVGLQGLDENWLIQEEIITMDGLVPVVTTTKWLRIFRMSVNTAGSSKTNVGNITATSSPSSVLTAKITAGVGQTNMAIYTIPARYTGYITKWYAAINRGSGVTAVAADVDLFRHNNGQSIYKSTQPVGIQNTGNGQWIYEFPFPVRMPEKADILVTATPTAVADITAGFSVFLVPN